ncbi:MAG: response regulator, partial [Verrucomicrobia subdivision 3 bacterium]|nr:response regulator [Limisphaerales bacterium]
ASAAAEAEKVIPMGRGEMVLVVDDEATVLSITREALETCGYRAVTARDGTEAINVFTAHRNDIKVVITDMLMPFMDGPATIRVLRKLEPNIPIIAASGLMDHEKVRDATGMDNIAFLLKPYTTEKLLLTLDKALMRNAIAPATDKAA